MQILWSLLHASHIFCTEAIRSRSDRKAPMVCVWIGLIHSSIKKVLIAVWSIAKKPVWLRMSASEIIKIGMDNASSHTLCHLWLEATASLRALFLTWFLELFNVHEQNGYTQPTGPLITLRGKLTPRHDEKCHFVILSMHSPNLLWIRFSFPYHLIQPLPPSPITRCLHCLGSSSLNTLAYVILSGEAGLSSNYPSLTTEKRTATNQQRYSPKSIAH